MNDPRAENCRRFAVDAANKVTGVALTHLPAPTAKYELVKAELIDEETARGQTVAGVHVLDAAGLPCQVQCYLAWPWQGWQHPNRFENKLLPGNTDYPYQHMITNKFDPAGPGPLAIFVGDRDGNVLSDVIAGLGLPAGRHVGYTLVFRERSAAPAPVEPPTPVEPPVTPPVTPPVSGDLTETVAGLAAQLARIEAKLDRLSRHLGAGV